MSRLSIANEKLALEIIERYPRPRSALIPLLHLAQAQDGFVSESAMQHIAELLDTTPSEVLSTCSFYEMFKRSKVGTYQVNICRGISCFLLGAEELAERAADRLGIFLGGTTSDGSITLEAVECVAACSEAPCLQVNYRYFNRVDGETLDDLLDDLSTGARPDLPRHGVLSSVRQIIPPESAAGVSPPEGTGPPSWWLTRNEVGEADEVDEGG